MPPISFYICIVIKSQSDIIAQAYKNENYESNLFSRNHLHPADSAFYR